MERHFHERLKELREKLLVMGSLVEKALHSAIKAVVEGDVALARVVIESDHAVNMMEIKVDDMCMQLLALHQPQAGDLRFIASGLKINKDLERLGDLAVNIAQRVLDLKKTPRVGLPADLQKMALAAQRMLKQSLDAFVNRDVTLAKAVCRQDDEVDELNRQIFKELVELMLQEDRVTIARCLEFILIAKNFEKVADHAVNICEDVIYIVDGTEIKHHVADGA